MPTLHVFKSTLPSINYIFKDGRQAVFTHGMYTTDNQKFIDELNEEIAAGHPHIVVDPDKRTMDSSELDPIANLRERLRAEILAEMEKASDPSNDMGKSEPAKLGAANSMDVASAAMGGAATVRIIKAPAA